jgi:pilus assembly protein CpaC
LFHSAVISVATAFVSATAVAQTLPPLNSGYGPPAYAPPSLPPLNTEVPRDWGTVTPISHQPLDPRRALDPRIAAMPQVDQKLEVIHHRSQLVKTCARVVRITYSDPTVIDIVQYSELEFSILGLGLGTTDLFIWFENDPEPLKYAVTVVHDPSLDDQRRIDYGKIERKLQILYPNSKVYLIPLSRRVIVRGQARDAEEAARIMQTIRIEVSNLEFAGQGFGDDPLTAAGYAGALGGPAGNGLNGIGFLNGYVVDELQVPGEFNVMLRVRMAELNHEQLRRYGVDIGVMFNDARHAVSSTLAQAPVLSGIFENGEVAVLIDALTTNGTGKVIVDQTMTVLAGEPAAFIAGGEFAVPTTVGLGGAAAATTSFRGFGTSVIATPTVIDRDLMRLQVVAEHSSINSGTTVGGIPGLNVKRVQTRVDLREGQTIVLGGLFGRTQRAEVTRIPLLGELPLIGPFLFNSKRATEDETELLIVVTPELVRPIDADQQPPLPGFNITHPNDHDFYKYNRTEGNPDMGHYQMLPYGQGQPYAEDVGYNVFNPAPAPGGIAPQGPGPAAYAPPPGNGYDVHGGYAPQGAQPPAGAGSQPMYYPPSQPVAEPQAQYSSPRGAVQQTSGIRGVPRNSKARPLIRR